MQADWLGCKAAYLQDVIVLSINVPACVDLLPVYHLGQSQLLTFWGTEEWSRKYRISLGIFWGAYYLPLPRRHPIISLIGPPIPGAALLQLREPSSVVHARHMPLQC